MHVVRYFKWSKTEIMGMTKKERTEWLEQINRIHEEERQQRFADPEAEIQRLLQSREEA